MNAVRSGPVGHPIWCKLGGKQGCLGETSLTEQSAFHKPFQARFNRETQVGACTALQSKQGRVLHRSPRHGRKEAEEKRRLAALVGCSRPVHIYEGIVTHLVSCETFVFVRPRGDRSFTHVDEPRSRPLPVCCSRRRVYKRMGMI
jgi:hypothetical protein